MQALRCAALRGPNRRSWENIGDKVRGCADNARSQRRCAYALLKSRYLVVNWCSHVLHVLAGARCPPLCSKWIEGGAGGGPEFSSEKWGNFCHTHRHCNRKACRGGVRRPFALLCGRAPQRRGLRRGLGTAFSPHVFYRLVV